MNKRNQIVITKLKNKNVLFNLENEKAYDIVVDDYVDDSARVGDIYLGKIKSIVKNINACFVEIDNKELVYLPLEEHFKCEDEILIQIVKTKIKEKKAVASTFIELVGKYSVVTTKGTTKSVSKKLNTEEKAAFEKLLSSYEKVQFGIIIRTNSKNTPYEKVKAEIDKSIQVLDEIVSFQNMRKPFQCLYRAKSNIEKFMDSVDLTKYDRVITDVSEIKDLLGDYCTFYDDTYPIKALLGLEKMLDEALAKKVWLNCGGNIYIERTEALTVIDVNSAKSISQNNSKEKQALKINIEACIEIARQLRIRNVSGIIVVDFIDMKNKASINTLINVLKDELLKDKTKTNFIEITKLNLVEITRAKVNRPLSEIFS